MKSRNTVKITSALAGCTSGLFLAFVATASPAGADPGDVVPPPAPAPLVPAPLVPAPPVPAPAPGPAPGPGAAVDLQASAPDPTVLPPNGTPHLASPNALPPGSTMDPGAADAESPNVSFLKDLWQAVQNKEISGKEALVLGLSQRGMDTPYPDQAPGPNVPITPGDPAPAAPPAPGLAPPPPAPVGPLPPTP